MARSLIVEADGGSGTVSFGVPVTVTDVDAGREQTFTIVGPTEADPGSGKISSESPVAQALLGAKPGETVKVESPGGQRSWRVEKLG